MSPSEERREGKCGMIAITEVYTELFILSSGDQTCIIQERGICSVRMGRREDVEKKNKGNWKVEGNRDEESTCRKRKDRYRCM